MRQFLFLALLFFGTSTWALSLDGFITVSNGKYYFVRSNQKKHFLIKTLTQETEDSLTKLKSTDYIQGQGEFRDNSLLLQSIDFVGLRRLLGVWASGSNAIFDFQDYRKVTVYKSFFNVMTPRARLQYSIAPSAGEDWKVFFTDENQVTIASLIFAETMASLRFFDPDTGEITKTLELSRIPQRH